uniref:Uncharacterized protein n=1 Tax=Candidozyma auris TaxID=498019 RepID=A0A0L0P2Y7_CANAR
MTTKVCRQAGVKTGRKARERGGGQDYKNKLRSRAQVRRVRSAKTRGGEAAARTSLGQKGRLIRALAGRATCAVRKRQCRCGQGAGPMFMERGLE